MRSPFPPPTADSFDPRQSDEHARSLSIFRFNRGCRWGALGMIFVLTAAGPALRFKPYDFPQYQMGAFVARERAWDSLYPVPR